MRCDAVCGFGQTIVEADLRKELELANPANSPTEVVLVGAGAGANTGAAYAFVEYGEPHTSETGGREIGCAEIAAETIVSVCPCTTTSTPPD